MVDVGNSIVVLFKKFNENVLVDDIGGEMILYDNSPLCPKECSFMLYTHIFTGISFKIHSKGVGMVIKDFYEDIMEYVIYNDYIYIKKHDFFDCSDPVAVVSFYPMAKGSSYTSFYTYFLEFTH